MSIGFEVSVDDGKYTVRMDEHGALEASRYDEPWRDLTGDKLIYWLAVELIEAREKIKELEK